MPQFDSTFFLAQIFWLLICFGALWAAMQFWVLPQLSHLQKRRKHSLERLIEEAKIFQQQAEILMKENAEYLSKSRQEAATLIHDSLQASQNSLEEVIQELKEAHHTKIDVFKTELAQQQEKALDKLKKEIPSLVQLCLGIESTEIQQNQQRPTL